MVILICLRRLGMTAHLHSRFAPRVEFNLAIPMLPEVILRRGQLFGKNGDGDGSRLEWLGIASAKNRHQDGTLWLS